MIFFYKQTSNSVRQRNIIIYIILFCFTVTDHIKMKKHDFFYGACTVNLSCFHIVSAWVLSVLWKTLMTFYGSKRSFIEGQVPSLMWSAVVWQLHSAVIGGERNLKSKPGNRLCLECPMCQFSFLWKASSGFLHYALVQQLTTLWAGWSGHNGWLTLNTMWWDGRGLSLGFSIACFLTHFAHYRRYTLDHLCCTSAVLLLTYFISHWLVDILYIVYLCHWFLLLYAFNCYVALSTLLL